MNAVSDYKQEFSMNHDKECTTIEGIKDMYFICTYLFNIRQKCFSYFVHIFKEHYIGTVDYQSNSWIIRH